MWNLNNEIIKKPKNVTINGIDYPKTIFHTWNEPKLNEIGIYSLTIEPYPDHIFYTYEEVLEGTTLKRNPIPKPIEDIKETFLSRLGNNFKEMTRRPKVPTELGFTVDGGREDLQNFELGKKYQIDVVVDADDAVHTINPETDYDTIISNIELYGISLWQKKQQKKAEINALETLEDCIDYYNNILDVWE